MTQRFKRPEGEIRRKRAGNFYPIFFVSFQSTMQKVTRHFFIFIQPLNDEWLKPPTGSNSSDSWKLNSSTPKIHFMTPFDFVFFNFMYVWVATKQDATHAGYSGTLLLKKGRSLQYSLYSHFTLKCRFM